MNKLELIDYLKKDLVLNCQIIEALKHDKCDVLSDDNDCVALYSHFSDIFMISCNDEDLATKVMNKQQSVRCALTFNKQIAARICEKYKLKTLLTCFQAVWINNAKLPINKEITIDKLLPTEYNVRVLYDNYSRASSVASVRKHLEKYGVFGAFVGGELAGFVGTHSEHSIGMLEVLPKFQRMGVGSALLSFISNYHMDNGIVPFAHIVDGNQKSYNLFTKNNFKILDCQVYWCY